MKPPSRNCCHYLLYPKADWGAAFCAEMLLIGIHFATGLRFSVQSLLLFSWCLFSSSPRPGTPLPCSQYPWEHSHCSTAQNRDSVSTFALEIHSSSAAWERALPSYWTQSLRIGFSTLILYSCVHPLSGETLSLPGSEKTRAFFLRFWLAKIKPMKAVSQPLCVLPLSESCMKRDMPGAPASPGTTAVQ